MKKMGLTIGLFTAGLAGLTAYTLMNKNTKAKADKLLNSMLDKATNMTNSMGN